MNFIKYTNLWLGLSALLIIPGIIALAVWGLQIGIDFRSGSLLEVAFTEKNPTSEEIKTALADLELETLVVQPAGQGSYILRTEPVDEVTHATILTNLSEKIGASNEIRFATVGPTISDDLTRKAIGAVIAASIAIILFIAFSFRGVPKPASSWRFGISAVLALLHDLLFVIGIFAILGHFYGYEVDSLFITALLTVMGFSVHDTIVVFDRMRENLKRHPQLTFTETANRSLTETLGRSLGTSLTIIFVLLALFLLGPQTIHAFVLALLLGITIGTYSSIFFATTLVVIWHNAVQKRLGR